MKITVSRVVMLTFSSVAATKPALKRIELPGRTKPKTSAD